MAFGDTRGTSSGGGFGSTRKKSGDLSTVEGLASKARELGFNKEADRIETGKPKLSALQRLSKGLSAFNPAEAILTGQEKGLGAGLYEYPKRIIQGIGSAITGTDYGGTQRSFKDVAEKAGIENGIAKFGIGFVGDVLLDPTTYFGGAIARGVGKVASVTGSTVLKGIGRVAPQTEAGLRLAGEGLGDALGSAFKFGYKASGGARTKLLTFRSKRERDVLNLVTENMARLGTNTLTKEQQKQVVLKLIAGKRAEFGLREAGKSADDIAKSIGDITKSADPLVQKTIAEQSARFKELAKSAGVENPYEVYFPFIKKEKVDRFISNTKGLKVGSEGYLKEFKNILTNEDIELDLVKAVTTREAQVLTNLQTRQFLDDFAKTYGKPVTAFKNSDEAAREGFEMLREKGIYGKELGYIPKWDAKMLNDSLSPEFQSIDMIAKATGFDAITALFKRAVTGPFVPFHVRNYVSGIIQNFEALGPAALNPRNIGIGNRIAYMMATGKPFPKTMITLGGKQVQTDEMMEAFAERFSGDTFFQNDFKEAIETGGQLRSAAPILSKSTARSTLGFQKGNAIPLLGKDAILFKTGRAVGQFIEHQQKATAYITALSLGKTTKEALELAEKAGFDYGALTRFESQILRRLIPFYSFTRKNIGLQLSTLKENPQRINQILAFFKNNPAELVGLHSSGPLTEEEKKELPGFIRESIGIKLEDSPEGLKRYISGFGTPIEAFTQLFGENPVLRTISQMNPVLKAPIELGIGKDSFRQRDLKDVYTANEYSAMPQWVKDLIDAKEVQKPILKKNSRGELKKVGERTVYIADPTKLLIARSLFTSRGVSYIDQVFDGDIEGMAKFVKATSGVKINEVDLQAQASFNETKKKRELEDLLTRTGAVAKFQRVYEPKE